MQLGVVTSAFQAPEFYLKCGFKKEFVRANKNNPKLTKTFFIKYFENESKLKEFSLITAVCKPVYALELQALLAHFCKLRLPKLLKINILLRI